MVIAAVLPCYCVYREVACWMAERQTDDANSNNPYQEWIQMYADGQFSKAVDEMSKLADELARETDAKTQRQMAKAFERAFQLEWMFWDAAYRMEQWEI